MEMTWPWPCCVSVINQILIFMAQTFRRVSQVLFGRYFYGFCLSVLSAPFYLSYGFGREQFVPFDLGRLS